MNTNNKNLNSAGVSLWLDNITRKILNDGTLKKYIDELSVTGLTSNPTIFDNAISKTSDYDAAIRQLGSSLTDEALFFELAVEDIQRAADAFKPVYDRTNGVDGFVSLEVSPVLAYDTQSTIDAAKAIFAKVNRPNVFIKIPGTAEGLPAIEQVIAAGIPVNVTLLFSADQYLAAAEAWLRGVEARAANGLKADVRSVASVFVSRWDKAVSEKVSDDLKNKLGIATSKKSYEAYLKFLQSKPVQKMMNLGVSPQRLLWASTGAKDPSISDVIYIEKLIAPFTVNTMPENTLLAFADHGAVEREMPATCSLNTDLLLDFKNARIDIDQLAAQLQKEGAESFVASWNHLITSIQQKRQQI